MTENSLITQQRSLQFDFHAVLMPKTGKIRTLLVKW